MKSLVFFLLSVCLSNAQDNQFPDSFLFGVGSASYQIEGAWNADGKGQNIWDFITNQNPDFVIDGSNGQVAADSYHKTNLDVQLLKNMSVDFYRFSISWSRILPTGHIYNVNDLGVTYYNNLINELLANDIIPFVTIYHWDLPLPLHQIGGWPNPALIDIYGDYADLLFRLFGDRVKNWITFNEPFQICEEGYSLGTMAPGFKQLGIGGYQCAHTLLRAHARAYRIYEQRYKATQNGKIGITIHGAWAEPASDSDADATASELRMIMTVGWFLDPILLSNDYPAAMRTSIDRLSAEQNFKASRLPSFTAAESVELRGSLDFIGLNHYGAYYCTPLENIPAYASHSGDVGTTCYLSEDWEPTDAPWFSVTPWGLKSVLVWIKDRYNNPEVIITENGFADSDGELRDCGRVTYYNQYLTALLEAINDEGCRVTGYTAWSFLDLFEWNYGYSYTFGMHHVDFTNAQRPRTPKMSSYVYKNIIETKQIDEAYAPEGYERCAAPALYTLNALIVGVLALLFVYSRQF